MLNLYCIFHAFMVILMQVLKVSPPPPLHGWRQSASKEGVALFPCHAGRKGRLGWASAFLHNQCGNEGGVTAQTEGGQETVPSPQPRGAQDQALGKGPGNLCLEVASLIVSVLQIREFVCVFVYVCLIFSAEQLGI